MIGPYIAGLALNEDAILVSHGRNHAFIPRFAESSPRPRVRQQSLLNIVPAAKDLSRLPCVSYSSFLHRPSSFFSNTRVSLPCQQPTNCTRALSPQSGIDFHSPSPPFAVIQEEVKVALAGLLPPSTTVQTTPAPSSNTSNDKWHVYILLCGQKPVPLKEGSSSTQTHTYIVSLALNQDGLLVSHGLGRAFIPHFAESFS